MSRLGRMVLAISMGASGCGQVDSRTGSPVHYEDAGVERDAAVPSDAGRDAGEPGAGGMAPVGSGGAAGMPPTCGNGALDPGEDCDGDILRDPGCVALGFRDGALGCALNCRYDTSECVAIPADAGQVCDLSGALPRGCGAPLCDCTEAFDGECGPECWAEIACLRNRCARTPGDPECESGCPESGNLDRAAIQRCMQEVRECDFGTCGNGTVEGFEECDGDLTVAFGCRDLGYADGELFCDEGCRVDYSGCSNGVCGDGRLGVNEICDGTQTHVGCIDLGYVGGEIACDPDSCFPDTSGCHRCGDGLKDPDEPCDGSDFGELTCRRFGFTGGTLACNACEVDTSGCAECGNGSVEGGERCDGDDLAGASCSSLGLPDGTLACAPAGCRFDTSGCGGHVPTCGDGVADRGEECDGQDLLGLDCTDLGYRSGTLTCSSSCRLDASACVSPPASSCNRCRERRCDEAYRQCADAPSCGLAVECGTQCLSSGVPIEQLPDCYFQCFTRQIDPVAGSEGINLLSSYLSCMALSCQQSCIGRIPAPDAE